MKNGIFFIFSGMASVEKSSEKVFVWLQEFDHHVQQLSELYIKNEVLFWNITVRSINRYNNISIQSNSNECSRSLELSELTNENDFILNK